MHGEASGADVCVCVGVCGGSRTAAALPQSSLEPGQAAGDEGGGGGGAHEGDHKSNNTLRWCKAVLIFKLRGKAEDS